MLYIQAATEIESNLRNDLEKKVEKMIDAKLKAAREQDIGTIGNIMKELTTTELSTIQGSLNNLATKQEQFISRERAELLIESCRAQLAQSMNSLEEQLAKVTSKAIATSTSSSETMLQKWKIDHENVLARLQQFVTHDEASDIAEVASKEQFARSMTVVKEMDAKSELRIKAQIFECRQQMQGLTETTKDEAAFIARKICYEQCEQSDRATAHSIQTQIDACQTHLMNNLTMQLRNYTTKEEASEIAVIKSKIEADRCFQVTADRCHGTAGKLVDLEAKLEDIESDFSSEVFKLRSTVKSIDIRVDSLETNCIGETSVRNELSDNCVHLDSMKEEIGTLELCAAPSNGESVTEGIMLLQTSHRAHEDPPLMQYNLDTKVQGTLSCKPSDADSPVPFDDKSEYSATSESASERSCLSIRSGRDVTHNNNDLDEQCTLIQERNRMLSNVARTLSAVAARRDDPSLRRLAAELRAGKLATDSSKSQHDHEPPVHAASDVNVDQQSELSSPQSDVESIDTAHAMSLCGVQLDEYTDSTRADRISRSLESPESFVGTIDTAEAISLCRLHVPSDQYGENSALDTQSQVHLQLDDSFEDQCIPAEKNPPENSFTKSLSPSPSTSSVASGSLSLQHLIRQSLTWEGVEFPPSQMQSSEISPSQKSFVGAPSLPAACHRFDTCEVGEKNKSVVERDHMPSLVAVRIELPPEQFAPELLDDEIATGSTAIKHFPGSLQTESADTDDHRPSNIVHSEHDAPDTNKVEMNVPAYDTTEPQPLVNESVKNSSLPSDDFVLTPLHTFSCIEDEESLPGSLASADEVFDCNLLSYKYNPTRIHNPEPYWGWDALLSELKASGRTLRDGDSSDGSISSYGSKSFEGDKWR